MSDSDGYGHALHLVRICEAAERKTLPRRVRAVYFCKRVLHAAKLVLRDERVPRPVRWLGALGLLPIPGPFDEAVLVLVLVVLAVFYRSSLRAAWRRT